MALPFLSWQGVVHLLGWQASRSLRRCSDTPGNRGQKPADVEPRPIRRPRSYFVPAKLARRNSRPDAANNAAHTPRPIA